MAQSNLFLTEAQCINITSLLSKPLNGRTESLVDGEPLMVRANLLNDHAALLAASMSTDAVVRRLA